MSDADVEVVLDGAASRLLAVACGDPARTPPTVRVSCLWTVELLRSAGATPTRRSDDSSADAAEQIQVALGLLGGLPVEVFAQRAVLEAAAAARAALTAAG